MARYADTLLAQGEVIALRTRQHMLAPIFASTKAFLLFIAGIVLFILGSSLDPTGPLGFLRSPVTWLGILGVIVGIAWIGLLYWRWTAEDYIVTNRRVLKVEGILNKHSADSSLEKINDAVLDQSMFGRMFGFGDLNILTANEESVDRYKWLNRAADFKKEMLNQKNALELGYAGGNPPTRAAGAGPAPAGGPAPAAPVSAPATHVSTPDEVTDTLARLADLRDRGAITAEEYEAKKADLLGRL